MRIARSTGAVSGVLIVLLGTWAALIPFVGPYFDYSFGTNATWHYTSDRLWLDVLPGALAVLGGMLLILAGTRPAGIFGGWLALVAGGWLVVGPSVSLTWESGTGPIGRPDARARRLLLRSRRVDRRPERVCGRPVRVAPAPARRRGRARRRAVRETCGPIGAARHREGRRCARRTGHSGGCRSARHASARRGADHDGTGRTGRSARWRGTGAPRAAAVPLAPPRAQTARAGTHREQLT
jgi:hypothetical protein